MIERFLLCSKNFEQIKSKAQNLVKTEFLPHREVSLGKPADCHCGAGDKQKQRPFMDRALPIGKR
jgi:hypothetical protein